AARCASPTAGHRQRMAATLLRQALRDSGHELTGACSDYDPLFDLIGDARLVLLGEGSHGTHEFYAERERITRRLIEEKEFDAVAVEADWPDAWRVDRWVRGDSDEHDAEEALRGFRRFPTWMWRNAVVVDFIGWLRDFNERQSARQARFFGIDLYSLYNSIDAVLSYLDRADPEAARRARLRYSCFDRSDHGDAQDYGFAVRSGLQEPCE